MVVEARLGRTLDESWPERKWLASLPLYSFKIQIYKSNIDTHSSRLKIFK